MAHLSVSDEVKELLSDIVEKNNFESTAKITYLPGSEIGDGYTSKTLSVDIENENKSLHLFIKTALGIHDPNSKSMLNELFAVETFFYDVLCPSYLEFSERRGVKDGFRNVPRFYGACDKKFREVIALENLRTKGYALFDRHAVMDENHFALIFKTFAKFHAVSFAFKDQNRPTYDRWQKKMFDFVGLMESGQFDSVVASAMKQFIEKLDPDKDKDILKNLKSLTVSMEKTGKTLLKKYGIITKGDCWNNNMMFLYEDATKGKPSDVMLIDWQMLKEASPVYDLSVMFYPMSTKDALDNIKYYLKIYHDELSRVIRELGSDPDVLYPYSAFEKEWNTLATNGLVTTIMMLRIVLAERDEAPNIEQALKNEDMTEFLPKIRKENEYMERVKTIARYVLKNKLF